MFSVSTQVYQTIWIAARWLFVFFALMLLFFAVTWLRSERKAHRNRFRSLPGAGTIGEMLVLSGNDQLPVNSWFPVPREGVLGSLRTCDLVIPCPGVRPQHLDFVWQDGTGLLLFPRRGCEVFINGLLLGRDAEPSSCPMCHGAVLQVGCAVLRLQLYAALDSTGSVREFPAPAGPAMQDPTPQAAVSPDAAFISPSGMNPFSDPALVSFAFQSQPSEPASVTPSDRFTPGCAPLSQDHDPSSGPDSPVSGVPTPVRRRSGQWKEDWSE